MKQFSALFYRELFIGFKNTNNFLISFFFFLVGVLIFIFAAGSDQETLLKIGHAIVWSIILFTTILSSEQFFLKDYLDGSLKELQVIGYNPEIIIITKTMVMWIYLILPLVIFTPLIGIMLQINIKEILILVFSIILGSPSLLLITSIGVLLTIQSSNNKVILLVLIFPFFIPILIFGVGAIEVSRSLMSPSSNFFILIAIFLITLPLTMILGKYAFKEMNN